MMTQSRSQLIDNLERYQQSGDFAAQTETLFALAKIARQEEEYSLAQALYAQAYTASEQSANPDGMAVAAHGIADLTANWDVWANLESLWWLANEDTTLELNRAQLWMLYEMALGLYIGVQNIRGQAQIYFSLGYLADAFNDFVAGQNAFILSTACYEAGGSTELRLTSSTLSERYSLHSAANRTMIERCLNLYRSAGHHELEGKIAITLADTALWAKDYATAHHYYSYACDIFVALQDHSLIQHILSRIARIAHRANDYALYRQYHAQALLWTKPQTAEFLTLWLELATIASDHRDLATARTAYQSAAAAAVAMGEPYRQCRIYWQWGVMEYKACHLAMGEGLCSWSIALVQHYDPDQVSNYQRELRQIRMREAP